MGIIFFVIENYFITKKQYFIIISNIIMLNYIILKNILYYLFWSVPTVFYEAWNNRDTIDDED